jgi:hypothetical protein
MYNAVSNAIGTINIGQYNTSPSTTFTTTNIRGDVNIGTVGGATFTTINRPLTVGYVPSAITNNTQIGYVYVGVINNVAVSSTFTYCTISSIPTGVWLFTWSIQSNGGVVSQYYSDLNVTGCLAGTAGANTTVTQLVGVGGNYYNATGACICVITSATGTATLRGTLTMSSGTQGNFNGYCNCVRIA